MWLRNTQTGLEWEVEGAHALELSANPVYMEIEAPDGSVFREGSGEDDMPLRPSGANPTTTPQARRLPSSTPSTADAADDETESPNRDSHQENSPTDKPDSSAGKSSRRVSRSRGKSDP